MSRMIFINLPVTHVEKSTAFYEAIGANRNQDFAVMYGHSYEDPDGHIRESMWMDVEAATKESQSEEIVS